MSGVTPESVLALSKPCDSESLPSRPLAARAGRAGARDGFATDSRAAPRPSRPRALAHCGRPSGALGFDRCRRHAISHALLSRNLPAHPRSSAASLINFSHVRTRAHTHAHTHTHAHALARSFALPAFLSLSFSLNGCARPHGLLSRHAHPLGRIPVPPQCQRVWHRFPFV